MGSKKKLIKIVIITVIVGVLLVLGVIGFMTIKENNSPEVVSARIEAEKQSNGYYERISELTKMMNQKSESVASAILSTISELTGTTKIDKIEKGGVKGNYTFYVDVYVLDVLIRGTNLEEIRIGNSIIYKRNTATDDTVIVQDKIYTFNEYDGLINRLSKDMKVSKSVAAKNFTVLTSVGLNNFEEIKKIKTDEPGVSKFKGKSMNIPIEITLIGETINKIEIVHEEVGTFVVYDKSSTDTSQHIRFFIPVFGERKILPDSLAYQAAQAMGTDITIRFPVTIDSGDDNWLLLKNGNELYCEVEGDITTEKGTDSKKFYMKRDLTTNLLTYLKVDKKVYLE